jgi:hypothetical protein
VVGLTTAATIGALGGSLARPLGGGVMGCAVVVEAAAALSGATTTVLAGWL